MSGEWSTLRVLLAGPAVSATSVENQDVAFTAHCDGTGQPETLAGFDVVLRHQPILVSPNHRALTCRMWPKAEADPTHLVGGLSVRRRSRRARLCGGSMGGSSALTYAALHPDLIGGFAALNATANHLEYENFQDAIRASFGGAKQQIPMEYKLRSAEHWLERFTMPVSNTASGADSAVPPEEGHQTVYADAVAAIEFAISGTGER